jgi:hypothetical protein
MVFFTFSQALIGLFMISPYLSIGSSESGVGRVSVHSISSGNKMLFTRAASNPSAMHIGYRAIPLRTGWSGSLANL